MKSTDRENVAQNYFLIMDYLSSRSNKQFIISIIKLQNESSASVNITNIESGPILERY